MHFDFDPEKSAKNNQKHGIDFVQAQALFAGEPIKLPSRVVHGEERSLIIGKINEVFWTAIVTERQGIVRIISCRRARDEERDLYEQES
jgi:uncharacterized DUF497 family protein